MADTLRWQYFSGCAYYEDRPPCDASTLVKFRQLLGDEGVEELLAQTVNTAVELKLIKPQELKRVIVDSMAEVHDGRMQAPCALGGRWPACTQEGGRMNSSGAMPNARAWLAHH